MWFYLLRGTEKQKRGAHLCQYSILPSFLQRCISTKTWNTGNKSSLTGYIDVKYFLDISFSDYFAVHDAMFVFQLHLCDEKAGKHDVVYFREYWIFCHLRQRSRISSERQYTGLPKSVSPPSRFIHEQKDENETWWRCFQVIGDEASKDEWVRDVCHFRRVSKTDSMPRPHPLQLPPQHPPPPILIRPK